MKKIVLLLALMSVLSFSVIADEGQIPIGGKSCPPNQNCLFSQEDPEPQETPDSKDSSAFDISTILKLIFG